MTFIFEHGPAIALEQKVTELEHDIQRFTRACRSAWPRPIDYTNLIDAQYALKTLLAQKMAA